MICLSDKNVVLIERKHPAFREKIARDLFDRNRDNLDGEVDFDGLLARSIFYNVHAKGGAYVGSIFCFDEGDKTFVGGYANRKYHAHCVAALRLVAGIFDTLYAKTRHVNAVICLRRAGFVWADRERGLLVYMRKTS
ncbi:MAG: hypothetical protein LBU87_03700 [Lactobacillales bacterium]|jgi:hypothetical protein|nr:hypothetical protein [Lactobacillales bacterium]